jgi:HNH endonuclease
VGVGIRIAAGIESVVVAALELVERAKAAEPKKDSALAGEVLEGIEAVGRAGQVLHGLLTVLVAQGDRLGVAAGGMGPWLASVLDMTEGRARSLAHDARTLTAVPDVEAELCSGRHGVDSIRAVARTVKSTRGTDLDPVVEARETLEVVNQSGARAGLERARVLEEHVDPGSVEVRFAQQRERSFARIGTAADGEMCRMDVLLDPERGAVVRAAIDLATAEAIRVRQYDGTERVPEDVWTTEQLNAEALTRLAQVFLDAPAQQRGASFSLPALAVTMKDSAAAEIPAGCARTVYGALIPARVLPKQGNPRLRVLEVEGASGKLDGVGVDGDPKARLASPTQREFLAWRDRCCRYPGCDRPVTWGLHAHHRTPYAEGGETVVENLELYCAQHHTVMHA